MCPIFNFCGKHFRTIGNHFRTKLIWLDKNIFHWRVEIDLNDDFIMYYFLEGPWIVKIVNCFCPLVLSTCHNWELLISRPHWPLCFKKIRKTTTTVFLFPTQQPRILTAIVQHSILNLSHPYFKFHVRLIDLSQSDIQILYGLQIDNVIVIRQCVNSSSVEFSRTS